MGHKTGWLALGAGIAGGADLILIPEIPYQVDKIAEAILRRRHEGKNFSILAVAEGSMSKKNAASLQKITEKRQKAKNKKEKNGLKAELRQLESRYSDNTTGLSRQLEKLTGLESRVSISGYVQRGGTPSVADRLLASRLGTACAELINNGVYSVMVASRGDTTEPVPLKKIVGKRKTVPLDHPWIESA
jgi:6-phosphofructokinase 1